MRDWCTAILVALALGAAASWVQVYRAAHSVPAFIAEVRR